MAASTFAFFIDELKKTDTHKNNTLMLMAAAQKRGYRVAYFTLQNLFYNNGVVGAHLHYVDINFSNEPCFTVTEQKTISLYECAAVMIRKSGPVDQNYLYATHLLDLVTRQGVLVSNSAAGIRNSCNKIFGMHFSRWMAPTLTTSSKQEILHFLQEHQHIVVKPVDATEGDGVIMLDADDLSALSLVEMITDDEMRPVMAQKFIAESKTGDKRIILINGEVVPCAYLRKPPRGDFRANVAVGGTGKVIPLTEQDQKICDALKAELQCEGLDLVGVDIIGDYLSEINVCAPGLIVLLTRESGIDIPALWMDDIESKLRVAKPRE